MKNVFTNILSFSIVYFALGMVDLSAIYWEQIEVIRFVTKPLLIILLIVFYATNDRESTSSKFVFLIIALGFFLLANVATLFKREPMIIMAASIFFILGKLFYIFRFSNHRDFNVIKFLPFIGLYLLYMFLVISLIKPNAGSYLTPILIFLFVSLMTIQFAFLRKYEVSESSYYIVLLGVFLMLFGDTIKVLGSFYFNWEYQAIVAMFLYVISQFLIVMGLAKEKIEIQKTVAEGLR